MDDQFVQMMNGDVRTPAKKARNRWKSGGASVIFILGSGSLDSIEVVDGKAGPYGPGIPNRKPHKPLRESAGPYRCSKSRTRPLFRYLHHLRKKKEWCGSRQLKKILNMQFSILSTVNGWVNGQAIRLGSRNVTGPVCLLVFLTPSALSVFFIQYSAI